MTLKKRFEDGLKTQKQIQKSDRILVAFSGGKDSVCLLSLLSDLSSRYGFAVGACHVHHGIRGEEADRDAAFCRAFCQERGLPFHLKHRNVPAYCKKENLGLEEGARILRYEALEEVRESEGYDKIATAHTASDQAETVLFRLVRGSGFGGLSGIPAERGRIIRPLLDYFSEEIEAYLDACGLTFISDSSNADMMFARNRIRLELLPAMKRINPSAELALVRFASLCAHQEKKNRDDAAAWRNQHDAESSLPLAELVALCETESNFPLLYRLFSDCAQKEKIMLDSQHFGSLLDLLKAPKEGKIIEIGFGYQFRVEKGFLLFEKKDTNAAPDSGIQYLVEPYPTKTELPAFDAVLTRSDKRSGKVQNINKNLLIIHLASDKIEGDLFVRPRRAGDRMVTGGMTKSIKKLFQEAGIPEGLRKYVPILCDEKGIVWVPFFGLCDRVRESETDEMITLTLSGNKLSEIEHRIERTKPCVNLSL